MKENLSQSKPNSSKLHIFLIIIIIALIATIVYITKFSPTLEINSGAKALANGEYSSAISAFDEAIKKDPSNIEAYTGKAAAQLSSGDEAGAADTMTTICTKPDVQKPARNKKTHTTITIYDDNDNDEHDDRNIECGDFIELLQAMFRWHLSYNVAIGKAELNEVLYHSIVNNGLNDIIAYTPLSPPTSNYESGKYDKELKVELSGDGEICYITEDKEFKLKESIHYTDPIIVQKNKEKNIIIAVAYDGLFVPSNPAKFEYTLEMSSLKDPVFSTSGGNYNYEMGIAITNPNSSGKIYYTTNGNDPTENSKSYNEKIYISEGTTTIKAKIIDKENNIESSIVSNTYKINLPKPEPETDDRCPECGSSNLTIVGNYEHKQRIRCLDCNNSFLPDNGNIRPSAGECPKCGSYDTYHDSDGFLLVCNACDSTEPVRIPCPICGSSDTYFDPNECTYICHSCKWSESDDTEDCSKCGSSNTTYVTAGHSVDSPDALWCLDCADRCPYCKSSDIFYYDPNGLSYECNSCKKNVSPLVE